MVLVRLIVVMLSVRAVTSYLVDAHVLKYMSEKQNSCGSENSFCVRVWFSRIDALLVSFEDSGTPSCVVTRMSCLWTFASAIIILKAFPVGQVRDSNWKGSVMANYAGEEGKLRNAGVNIAEREL